MISKIYFGLIAASTAIMAFYTFYANSWLQSIGSPSAAIDGFSYHFGSSYIFLWFSALVLLVTANIVLWFTDRAWAIWVTLLYFIVFILCRVWLLNSVNEYQRSNSLPISDPHGFSTFILFGICIVGLIFAFCDQFAVVRLRRTMYAQPDRAKDTDEPSASDPAVDDEGQST